MSLRGFFLIAYIALVYAIPVGAQDTSGLKAQTDKDSAATVMDSARGQQAAVESSPSESAVESERYWVLGVGMVILGGFGFLLNLQRRKVDVEAGLRG